MEKQHQHPLSPHRHLANSTEVSVVKGATTLGNKAFSPNPLKIR